MDIKQLKYFLATVDYGNMTRAADSLHIAQPALSQQIAGLERDLGSKLLERSVRGVKPTVAGEVLYRHAKGLLRHVEDLKGAVSFEREHPSGRVSVGMSGGVARLLLVPLLEALRACPGILLEVIVRPSSELAGLVAQGGLDMAIAIDALPQRGIAIQPLFREELYVALPRAASLRRTSGISLEELAKLPLALPTIMTGINQTIMMALAMVVVASMVGVGGLGKNVLQAINNQFFTVGFLNGFALVAIAIMFDRVSQAFGKRLQKYREVSHG